MNCRCCHQPLHSYTQPALLAGRPDRTLAECRNVGNCVRAYITLTPQELARLSDDEAARYAQPEQVTA